MNAGRTKVVGTAQATMLITNKVLNTTIECDSGLIRYVAVD